jgi:anaerobic selenocysteine-containing dehydrogenase
MPFDGGNGNLFIFFGFWITLSSLYSMSSSSEWGRKNPAPRPPPKARRPGYETHAWHSACPECGARSGNRCYTAGGNVARTIHYARNSKSGLRQDLVPPYFEDDPPDDPRDEPPPQIGWAYLAVSCVGTVGGVAMMIVGVNAL